MNVALDGLGFQITDATASSPSVNILVHNINADAECGIWDGGSIFDLETEIDALLRLALQASYFASSRGESGLTEPLIDPWDGIVIKISKSPGKRTLKAHLSSIAPLRVNITSEFLRILTAAQNTVDSATTAIAPQEKGGIDKHIDMIGGFAWIQNKLGVPFIVKVYGTSLVQVLRRFFPYDALKQINTFLSYSTQKPLRRSRVKSIFLAVSTLGSCAKSFEKPTRMQAASSTLLKSAKC